MQLRLQHKFGKEGLACCKMKFLIIWNLGEMTVGWNILRYNFPVLKSSAKGLTSTPRPPPPACFGSVRGNFKVGL